MNINLKAHYLHWRTSRYLSFPNLFLSPFFYQTPYQATAVFAGKNKNKENLKNNIHCNPNDGKNQKKSWPVHVHLLYSLTDSWSMKWLGILQPLHGWNASCSLMLCYVFPVSAANSAKLLPTCIIILLSGVLKGCTVHSEKYIQVSYWEQNDFIQTLN